MEAECKRIAKRYDYDLVLPKGGTNNSLRTFVFEHLKLPVAARTKKRSEPSINSKAMDHYKATLEEGEKLDFINNLSGKRARNTAVTFTRSYKLFGLPVSPGWAVLHPSLNSTGSDTLRFTSSNPNEQNISKREGFNLRYSFGS